MPVNSEVIHRSFVAGNLSSYLTNYRYDLYYGLIA